MKNKQFLLLSITSLIIFISFNRCKLDSSCYQQYEVPVIRLELPDSAEVNTAAEATVTYVNYSNCQKFYVTTSVADGDTISAHILCYIEDCDCPNVQPDSITTFSFTGKVAGKYFFRMWKYDNTILQDSLIVYSKTK